VYYVQRVNLLTLAANIRLRWKWLAAINALASNITILITTVKRFTAQAQDDSFGVLPKT
jgi:hypothetical protein